MTELTEQPIPEDAACPECNGDPTEESVVQHRLSQLGYLHDDVDLECQECGETWLLGIPVGQSDEFRDLLMCPCCREFLLPHRAMLHEHGTDVLKLRFHMKCPNCYFFDVQIRESDNNGVILMGYPQITGEIDGAEPFGYDG